MNLQGKYTSAEIFTSNADSATLTQVQELLNQPFMSGTQVRIMPDCHAGAGCVIGTTFRINDKVVPNLVGVDIGCGMHVTPLPKSDNRGLDLAKLDRVIHELIPAGFAVRNQPHKYTKLVNFDGLICKDYLKNMPRVVRSVGTLGGGNHFIELDEDKDNYYLVIHTGSRNLGKQVAEYYQTLAIDTLRNEARTSKINLLNNFKATGNTDKIQAELANLPIVPPNALCYLSGQNLSDYLHDMSICQAFANENRKAITEQIINAMGWKEYGYFVTMHNFISGDKMLRKGAVSANKDETLIIPINMRDGSLICKGKGNPDWNYSAPHGAGRLMARGEAKRKLTMDDFTQSMKGIYTTSVSRDTLDESPMAYKSMEEIIENTADTIEIVSIIKPIYNFKAGGD